MGSTKKEDRIDVNGRAFQLMRKRARAQGRKVTSSKRSSSDKVTGSREGGARKAAGYKLADLGSRHEEVFIKFGGPRCLRRGKDKGIGGMFHVERNLVW